MSLPSPKQRDGSHWNLAEATEQFGEIARRARSEGPQRVEIEGSAGVVIISAEDMARLEQPGRDFVTFMESLHLPDIERDNDVGRVVEL